MSPPPIELEIERLSQWGEGVGMWEGRTVFVEGAFPTERVRVDVAADGKVLRGRVVARLRSSQERRTSPCPVSDACGGCDWLELDDARQLEARKEILLSSLEHLGGLRREELEVRPPIVPDPRMGYRRRGIFHVDKEGLGLFSRRSHQLVRMAHCPALVPELERLPGELSSRLQEMLRDLESVDLLAEGGEVALAIHLKGALRPRHRQLAEGLLREGVCRGVVLLPKEGSPELVGRPVLRAKAPLRPDVSLHLRPDAFSQAHASGGPRLVQAALERLGARDVDTALELFSGNGFFTFALAARVRSVLCVEGAPVSCGLAQRSASEARVTNVRFVQGDVASVCRGLLQERRTFDLLLADPPRTGAPDLARWARGLGVRRVVYVACDAASLARDAAAMQAHGFQPKSVQLVDMFPQTRHVEAVMDFERVAVGAP